jgi:DNA-3-methyladenine glycosylase II
MKSVVNRHGNSIPETLDKLFVAAKLPLTTKTKAGWCLFDGLCHVASVPDSPLLDLVLQHGLPAYLSCCSHIDASSNFVTIDVRRNLDSVPDDKDGSCWFESTSTTPNESASTDRAPKSCFECLCRIVVGQSVSGLSAKAAWSKLLALTRQELTPATIASYQNYMDALQKPVGLTKTKATCLVDLARHFCERSLSEEFFTTTANDDEAIRASLLKVRGIGPWSCDMFLLFYLERPNILPLGDLLVRKGLAKYFGVSVADKTANTSHRLDEHYAPFTSLLAYYVWRSMETSPIRAASKKPSKSVQQSKSPTPSNRKTLSTPRAKRQRTMHREATP